MLLIFHELIVCLTYWPIFFSRKEVLFLFAINIYDYIYDSITL